jgi:hypothetical protein
MQQILTGQPWNEVISHGVEVDIPGCQDTIGTRQLNHCRCGQVMANALCDWSLQLAGGRDIPVAIPTFEDVSVLAERIGMMHHLASRMPCSSIQIDEQK